MTKKARFIEKMTALSKKEKAQAISFFSKFPNYENRIDWNCKNLQFSDFKKVFALAENSVKNQKRKEKENPRLMFEKYNCEILCQTEDFLLVIPLDWECAVFFNSYNCGGEGAKWCIGDSKSPQNWYNHARAKNIYALVYFTKRNPFFGRKIIIEYFTITKMFVLWLQNDEKFDSQEDVYELFKRYFVLSAIEIERKTDIDMYVLLLAALKKKLPIASKALLQKIFIPNYIDGLIFKSWGYTEAVEAAVPSDVTAIGDAAFAYCENLRTIELPDGVISIGDGAFAFCKNLKTIELPDGITSIGKRTFAFCKNLKTINIPAGITSIGEYTFEYCIELTTINIPTGVKYIGKEAFSYCKNLVSVNIPKGTHVDKNAFEGCEKLTITRY